MGVLYEKQVSGIVINGGDTKVIAVDIPNHSFIHKFIVEQYDGVPAAFTIELYNSKTALELGDSLSDSVGVDDMGPLPKRLAKICPTKLSDDTGYLEYFADDANGGTGFPFICQDNVPARGYEPGRQGRITGAKLYLKIMPAGTGEKRYAVAIGSEQAVE